MPARVIRGEINASNSLARVSVLADLTYRSLLVAVDDFGRIDARIPVLRGILFPMRPAVTEKRLDECLDELSAGDDPPLVRYEVAGRPYLALTGWEKHRGKGRRALTSRCPEPHPLNCTEILGNLGDPPEKREAGSEGREARSGGRDPSAASAAAHARGSGRAPKKTQVPDELAPEDRDRVIRWAGAQTPAITNHALRFAWRAYHSKARAKGYVYADHARGFMNAIGAAGEAWALEGYQPPAGAPSSRYRSAEDVIAEAKRKQVEDDERARAQPGEARKVADVIDLSLRQAGGAA